MFNEIIVLTNKLEIKMFVAIISLNFFCEFSNSQIKSGQNENITKAAEQNISYSEAQKIGFNTHFS